MFISELDKLASTLDRQVQYYISTKFLGKNGTMILLQIVSGTSKQLVCKTIKSVQSEAYSQ